MSGAAINIILAPMVPSTARPGRESRVQRATLGGVLVTPRADPPRRRARLRSRARGRRARVVPGAPGDGRRGHAVWARAARAWPRRRSASLGASRPSSRRRSALAAGTRSARGASGACPRRSRSARRTGGRPHAHVALVTPGLGAGGAARAVSTTTGGAGRASGDGVRGRQGEPAPGH